MRPKYLYKFRCFEEKHLRILTNNEIFFSSPANFNDPFDGTIPLHYDQGSIKEITTYWFDRFRKTYPHESEKESLEKAIKFAYLVKSNSSKTNDRLNSQAVSSLNKAGVYCLSATHSNLLLWSHYTSSHTGFAIGFHHSKLVDFSIKYQSAKKQILIIPHKMKYIKEYPNLNVYKLDENKRIFRQLFTKSKSWSYEKEYRLLLMNGSNQIVVLDDFVIDRVILGCKISDSVRKIIIAILKQRIDKPRLFEAVKDETSFSLAFKPIKY